MTLIARGEPTGPILGVPENYKGSDLDGTEGPNRTLDVGIVPNLIVLERETLQPVKDYEVDGTVITFLVDVYNMMRITVWK